MCRRDWYLVPRELRDQVWATWRSGQGAFTPEHQAAVLLAIRAVRERRPERHPAATAARDEVTGRRPPAPCPPARAAPARIA